MVTIKEQLRQALDELSEPELQQLAEYLSFIRFRNRVPARQALNSRELAKLYGEFADEDVALAETDVADYQRQLTAEDNL